MLVADAVIGRGILEQEGIRRVGQFVPQRLEGAGLLAPAGQADMPLVHQHQPEDPRGRRQAKEAALPVQERAGRLHRQADAVGALAIQRIDDGRDLAPMLIDQVHARRGQDDLQFIESLESADMVDVLQDVQMHQQGLAASRGHPIGQQVAPGRGGVTPLLPQHALGEVEGQNLVIPQPDRLVDQLVVSSQPVLHRVPPPLLHARFGFRGVAFHRLLVARIEALAASGLVAQQPVAQTPVERQVHAAPRSKSVGPSRMQGRSILRRSAQ